MEKIHFRSAEHEKFYNEMMSVAAVNDSYHRAFFYTIGISKDTRNNIHRIFNFEQDCICPKGLSEGWQTNGSLRVTRLAFNLWNGYAQKKYEKMFMPYELFDCGYASHFFEAIKLRYPEYTREARNGNKVVDFIR